MDVSWDKAVRSLMVWSFSELLIKEDDHLTQHSFLDY